MHVDSGTGLRLSGTRIAEFFRFGCERQLRYQLVPPALRGDEVPAPNSNPALGPRVGPRPGAELLLRAGRRWERRKILQLISRIGEDRVLTAGWTAGGSPRRLPFEEVVQALRDPGTVEVLVQPELRLPDPEAFARRFGMDPERVRFTPAIPDLIRIRTLADGRRLFQVVDIKASAGARLSHYAQVAFYTLVLEEICAAERTGGEPDLRWGRIWSRDGRGPRRFPLAAYRHHVARLLSEEVARVVALPPQAAAWHVAARCAGCDFLEHCRAEADANDDVSRVAGITPAAKRVLAQRGIRTVRQLADSIRKDTYEGCHALESQADRLKKRAHAVRFNKLFELDSRTHLMPPDEDVRVILTAEGDPVTGLGFALGMRVDGRLGSTPPPAPAVWLAERGHVDEERRILGALLEEVDALLCAVDELNQASGQLGRGRTGRGGRGASVHFYVVDAVELDLLRRLLLRHLGHQGMRPAIARMLRILSPRALSARPDAVRNSPGTVLSAVVSALFALPIPYSYDLAGVSDRLRPASDPRPFDPPPGYAWPFSSQIAFERVHEAWSGGAAAASLKTRLQGVVLEKLAAVDSVVRAIRERTARRERLQMRTDPFRLQEDEGPIADPVLEELRIFAEMESAAEAVATRALHVLPAVERARRFECLRGMHLVERRADGTLLFEFDPACRDAKFRPGDFNLVLTNDDDRSLLETDRQPWRRRKLAMELVDYDLHGDPPRVVLAPSGDLAAAEAEGWIDLDRVCVLDRAPADFSTARILATLRALGEGRGEAAAVLALLRGERPNGWTPLYADAEGAGAEVLAQAARAYGRPVLNADQARAWRAGFRRPLSLVWGPPGTGKTYLLAWMLIGIAAAAHRAGRPCRILVTAATHRAIVNVLARLSAELAESGVNIPLRAVKLRGSGNEADAELDGGPVEVVSDGRLAALLREAEGGVPLIVGSTVWSLWKRMRAEGADEGGAPVQPWFDVVVVDEASQMKVAEALIALSSMRARASVVLSGDDRQLAPVLKGRYDEAAGSLYGSVFSHLAAIVPRLGLRETRRMNQALVEYPRTLFYPGLVSMVPDRKLHVAPAAGEGEGATDRVLRELFLAPEDAVVLCTYRGVRATARNAFEAALAASLARLARTALLDPDTGRPFEPEAFVSEALAIVCPHRAQNAAILAELGRSGFEGLAVPVVDTVERMQGNERDLIIVSFGVADREYAEAEAEFLLNPNRFNVAITRARSKLIVLLSEEVLDAVPAEEEVLGGSMALKAYPAHCSDAVREVELAAPDGAPVAVRCSYRKVRG